jgi:hypothetical protein
MPAFSWKLEPIHETMISYPRMVTKKEIWYPPVRRKSLFDIEVEDNHRYVAGGILVHNSYGEKTTTPAGLALKHYASVRVKVDRIGTVREKIGGEDVAVCIRTKADVRKNKTAAPFKVAEFYITFGHGIDIIAAILDGALARKVVENRGSWFAFQGEQLAQGRMETLSLLRKNQALCDKISAAVEDAKARGVVAEPEPDKFPMKRPKQDTKRVPVTDPDSLETPEESTKDSKEDEAQVTDA